NESEKVKNHILKNWDAIVEIREPAKNEQYPILLKNNKFVKPFELVTELFSLPNSSEIDPNAFMAPFFFFFFGLMVGDAGYGLLMVIGTSIILRKFKFEGTIGKLIKLLFYCGISTFIWGALLGGWFGDVVSAVTGGAYAIKPIWFNPLEDPMKLLIWSFVFGVIHLFTGMGLNAYKQIREGKIIDAIFDTGFWYIFLIGLMLLLVGGTFASIGKYMAGIGAVLLVITQGRSEKNIFKKFTKGLLSLYNSVGFFSDVLSYSRLLALGLSTGVVASVINTIGTLFGFGPFGIIVFIVAFVIGSLFNMLINVLGAYVHSSRLQYVEFFGKFYEGGGKAFEPFKIKTKYTKLDDRRTE
ncbi:MAG TPA: V-type ATP synthase subunit I, partial [Clostridiaceae bacterium]|nr:V-type ATP synthase subunit I [Clostridiaceae bacterium]